MSDQPQLSPHAARNRQMWDADSSDYQSKHGPQLASSGGAAWGVWQLAESELRGLGDVRGKDVLELGCGAAQWSIALHAGGARMTGLDNSAVQLAHARELMAQAGADFPLVHASAESTPFADASFDIVFCDHGAMAFADPYRTVPEAARLLRADGLLAFSMNTPILDLLWPLADAHPGERLARDYWDLHKLQAADEPVEFQLPYGAWIALFADHGFAVQSLIELRPPPHATSSYRDAHDLAWARRWPMEHIWRVRRTRAAQA